MNVHTIFSKIRARFGPKPNPISDETIAEVREKIKALFDELKQTRANKTVK